jgi:hypothetical protein
VSLAGISAWKRRRTIRGDSGQKPAGMTRMIRLLPSCLLVVGRYLYINGNPAAKGDPGRKQIGMTTTENCERLFRIVPFARYNQFNGKFGRHLLKTIIWKEAS